MKREMMLATLSVAALLGAPVNAQSAPGPDGGKGAATDDSATIRDIVVTAQRRSESAQRVPISVQSFDTARLDAVRVTSNADLPQVVPGVAFQQNGNNQSIFVRGIGNGSAVLKYTDGILQVFGNAQSAFNNLARVEVDKGPQSTLFGRNATGGVIQFITKTPSTTPSADVSVGYANYNTFTGSLYATAGLGDHVASDLSVYFNRQNDGWGKNIPTGEDTYRAKNFAIRNKTRIELSDAFTATTIIDYHYDRSDVGTGFSRAKSYSSLFNYTNGTNFLFPRYYDTNSNSVPQVWQSTLIGGLRLEGDLGFARALSVTSYQWQRSVLLCDYDASPTPYLNLDIEGHRHAWTQEFQLLSQPSSPVQWVAGLFYLSSDANQLPFAFQGPGAHALFGVPAGSNLNVYNYQATQSYAAFGQATIPIFKDTQLTLGARYTIDRAGIHGYLMADSTLLPGSSGSGSKTFRRPTFRASLDHQFTPAIMGYVSYNRGYNAGGFNDGGPGGFGSGGLSSINPETIDAYEAGVKSTLLGNRLRLNLAGFHYLYSNLQLPIFQAGNLFTVNAAAARINGLDMDFELRPARGFSLTGGLLYLNSVYTSYPNAPLYSFTGGALGSQSGDATGKRTVNAPDLSATGTAQYEWQTRIGSLTTAVSAAYTGRIYYDPSNAISEPPRTIVNVSETWKSTDNRTSLSLWVKNLANLYYDSGINLVTPIGAAGIPGAPRTFGFSLNRHF